MKLIKFHTFIAHTHLPFSDRFVILGNHRDAWVFGGVDPNSGTAALMELARALSDLRSIGELRCCFVVLSIDRMICMSYFLHPYRVRLHNCVVTITYSFM